MIISAIVAYTQDDRGRLIIGKDNKLPWRIPKDMAWFRECTNGAAIVMGRKTYESIGRVLPNRDNIIISRDPDYKVPGAQVFSSLQDGLQFAGIRNWEVFIIGGQQLYEQTIDIVDRVYLTYIRRNPGYFGDTFFPSWDRSKFKVIHREEIEDPQNGAVIFKVYQRNIYDTLEERAARSYNSEEEEESDGGSGI